MEGQYVFDPETKELKTGGDVPACSPGGVGKFLFEKIKSYAELGFIAQVDAETGYEDTYDNFFTRCKKIAIYMLKLGIKPGDIVLSCSPINSDNMTVFISCLFVGAVYAATEPALTLEDTTYIMKMMDAKLMFVSKECLNLIETANCCANNCKLVLMQTHNMYDNLPTVYAEGIQEEIESFEPVYIKDPSQTLCIVFSSGTTGVPKGVCLSHHFFYSIIDENVNIAAKVQIPHQLLVLNYSNPFWTSCIQVYLHICAWGLKRLISSQFNGALMWELVDRFQVSQLSISYFQAIEAIDYLTIPRPNVMAFGIAGAQIPIEKQQLYGKMLPNSMFYSAYGITEAGSVTLNGDFNNPSCGKPINKNQIIKIVDPETEQALDLNKVGEVRIKHKCQMNGYYKRNSDECYDSNGFFKTGDLGYFNDKFELFIVARISQTFKYRNHFVVPSKIERHLESHESVHQCVVIGVAKADSADADDHPMAIVVLKDNCLNVSKDDLLSFSNDNMNTVHQLRAGLRIVPKDVIPYTTTGKVNRRILTAKVLQAIV